MRIKSQNFYNAVASLKEALGDRYYKKSDELERDSHLAQVFFMMEKCFDSLEKVIREMDNEVQEKTDSN